MARHCENGQAVAEFLASHPKIAYVDYCGLPGNAYHALAQKYLPHGSCGVVSFGVKGGREAAKAFMGYLKKMCIRDRPQTAGWGQAHSFHRLRRFRHVPADPDPAYQGLYHVRQ